MCPYTMSSFNFLHVRRYDLFPVQHELCRRRNEYNNAINEIKLMPEPYISSDSNCCDGINYWALLDEFSWKDQFQLSSYTRNFAAIIIQRRFRHFKAFVVPASIGSSPAKSLEINRPFKSSRQSKAFKVNSK